jgi:hypothetical protein
VPQIELFNKPLTGVFQPSKPFMLVNGLAVVDFALTVTVLATVEWYYELTSDPPSTAAWFREVAEESPAAGVVVLTPLVRKFLNLVPGAYLLDVQSAKAHDFCRLQLRVSVGAAQAKVVTPTGLPAS